MSKSGDILEHLAGVKQATTGDIADAVDDTAKNTSALLTYLLKTGRVRKVSGGAGAGVATWALVRGAAAPAADAAATHSTLPAAPAPKRNGARYGGSLPPIESGVPIPGVQRPLNKYRAGAQQMKRGDRRVFTDRNEAAALAAQIRKEGGAAAVRTIDGERFGVWKVK